MGEKTTEARKFNGTQSNTADIKGVICKDTADWMDISQGGISKGYRPIVKGVAFLLLFLTHF